MSETIRSQWLAMAKTGCCECAGLGNRAEHGNAKDAPCDCVLRAMCRSCLGKYRQCSEDGHAIRLIPFESTGRAIGQRCSNVRISQEYCADVWLIAKRTLSQADFRIFRGHMLEGRTYSQMRIERGGFFHAVYRIEAKLGLAFLQTRPYPVFPLDGYFQRETRAIDIRPFPGFSAAPVALSPLRPPGPDFDLHAFVKARFAAGITWNRINIDLWNLGVAAPDGVKWSESDLKAVLIGGPGLRSRRKAA